MRYLTFETDLFFTDIPDDQLDHWFIGGDCAGWFYARLLPEPGIKRFLEPTMEDWGWIMAVESAGITVDICVWEYPGHEGQWILGVVGKKKFLKKTDRTQLQAAEQLVESVLGQLVEDDPRFLKAQWLDSNPME